jgi:hypothetical protein
MQAGMPRFSTTPLNIGHPACPTVHLHLAEMEMEWNERFQSCRRRAWISDHSTLIKYPS